MQRLREVEVHKIRAEERAAARAEIERVLSEQQHFHAKQLSSLRNREMAAAEAQRRKASEFEASRFEQRQKMLHDLRGCASARRRWSRRRRRGEGVRRGREG